MPTLPESGATGAGRAGRPRDPGRDGTIRAATLQVLGEAGYAGLTMDAVAAAAGVGKATIYRRWKTKSDLVTDAVGSLSGPDDDRPDTGSFAEDLRLQLHWLVDLVNGPLGAATLAVLSALPHEPELRTAFHDGPLTGWSSRFRDVWTRAVARGEIDEHVLGSVVATAASSPIVQRWLFSGLPVDRAYADQVLAEIVLPLVRTRGSGPG